jgi:hypothetical protein
MKTMNTTDSSTRQSNLTAVLPWLVGTAVAFALRTGLSIGGVDPAGSDTIAIFAFVGSALAFLTIPRCVATLRPSGGDRTAKEKIVAVTLLVVLGILLVAFGYFAYGHGLHR